MINVFCFVFRFKKLLPCSTLPLNKRASVYLFFRVNLLKKRTKKGGLGGLGGGGGDILFHHIYKYIYQCLPNS
jgi:hypothetical protein